MTAFASGYKLYLSNKRCKTVGDKLKKRDEKHSSNHTYWRHCAGGNK